jgi:hypothetical protein
VAQPEHADRHQQRDAVDDEKQDVLAAKARAFPVAPRPVPVGEVGERHGADDRDRLRAQRLVVQRPLAAGEAQQVEQADVDDERDGSDDPELGQLVHEVAEASIQGVHP